MDATRFRLPVSRAKIRERVSRALARRQAANDLGLALWVLIGSVVVAAACQDEGLTGPSRNRVTQGAWGGEHIALNVVQEGGTIELDCAHGTIDEPMMVDSRRRFDVKGTFVLEQGGPLRPGQTLPSRPARYSGSVDGKKMALTVRFTDRDEAVGNFNLVLGQSPRLIKCL